MTATLGKTYANMQVIVKQGDIGDCMFAIQAGRVEVVKHDTDGDVRVAVLENGDIFGEMAIFEREVRSATVRALGEARVLTVDRKTFLRRVQEDPSIAFNLVRMMSGRIRRLSTEVARLKGVRGQKTGGPSEEEQEWPLRDRRRGADRRSGRERRTGIDRRNKP